MNNFELSSLEAFLERQLGNRDRACLRLASLAKQGWDTASLTELASSYAKSASPIRRFDITFIDDVADPQLELRRR